MIMYVVGRIVVLFPQVAHQGQAASSRTHEAMRGGIAGLDGKNSTAPKKTL
jgi:hypothetical protein